VALSLKGLGPALPLHLQVSSVPGLLFPELVLHPLLFSPSFIDLLLLQSPGPFLLQLPRPGFLELLLLLLLPDQLGFALQICIDGPLLLPQLPFPVVLLLPLQLLFFPFPPGHKRRQFGQHALLSDVLLDHSARVCLRFWRFPHFPWVFFNL